MLLTKQPSYCCCSTVVLMYMCVRTMACSRVCCCTSTEVCCMANATLYHTLYMGKGHAPTVKAMHRLWV